MDLRRKKKDNRFLFAALKIISSDTRVKQKPAKNIED